jgi:type I restriction enzyme M protein
VEEGDGFENDRDAYTMDNIFYIPEEARWSTISAAAHTPEIGKVIDNAMRAIEAENKTLKGVLPNNYANPDLDKQVLGDVVDIFTNMDMGDAEESQDLLGRTYEYCLRNFAEQEGKNAGQFYTPSCVVRTIVEILQPYNGRVYESKTRYLIQFNDCLLRGVAEGLRVSVCPGVSVFRNRRFFYVRMNVEIGIWRGAEECM